MTKTCLVIPSCGRPDRLKKLLNSLDLSLFFEVLIVNTTPGHQSTILSQYDELSKVYRYNEVFCRGWALPKPAKLVLSLP
jgi:hypothetical protein